MDWNDLKIFLTLAEAKSLSAAGLRLGVSPSTVSRRIEALEHALKLQLFRPHRDGYDLTAEGLALLPEAERAGAQMQLFEREAAESGDELTGTVRIEAPELLGQQILLPALAGLMVASPGLRIELRGAVQPVRLSHEAADIVIRLVRPGQGNYRMRRIGAVPFCLCASADYVRRHGLPEDAAALGRQRVIGWSEDLGYLTMAAWLSQHFPQIRPALRLTSFAAQVEAVRLGFGWAVLPEFIAKPEGFVAWEQAPPLSPDLWLLTHAQTEGKRRVTLVRDCLTGALTQAFPR